MNLWHSHTVRSVQIISNEAGELIIRVGTASLIVPPENRNDFLLAFNATTQTAVLGGEGWK